MAGNRLHPQPLSASNQMERQAQQAVQALRRLVRCNCSVVILFSLVTTRVCFILFQTPPPLLLVYGSTQVVCNLTIHIKSMYCFQLVFPIIAWYCTVPSSKLCPIGGKYFPKRKKIPLSRCVSCRIYYACLK